MSKWVAANFAGVNISKTDVDLVILWSRGAQGTQQFIGNAVYKEGTVAETTLECWLQRGQNSVGGGNLN